jgi:DnaK suppressor protein
MSIDPDKARDRLTQRRLELRQLSEMSSQSRAPVSLDQQSIGRLSRMDAMQQQAMAQSNERQRSAELARIDAALKRIETGDYGYCLECGDEIVEKRLAFDASVALCIACANKATG